MPVLSETAVYGTVATVWNPSEISEGKTRLLVLEFSRAGQIWFPEAENVVLHRERSVFVP